MMISDTVTTSGQDSDSETLVELETREKVFAQRHYLKSFVRFPASPLSN